MSVHRLHAWVLCALLAAGSVFYLFAPGVYAYFSEAGMSYGTVPKWFATTPSARITARVFDRYNARAPRASRFNSQLSCFLSDDGAKRRPGCTHELTAGRGVHGPTSLKIASGAYVAHFDFAASDGCAAGEALLQVVTTGRFGRVLAEYSGPVSPGERVELPFHLKSMDAALGAVEFRATGIRGCALLGFVDWMESPAAASRQAS